MVVIDGYPADGNDWFLWLKIANRMSEWLGLE